MKQLLTARYDLLQNAVDARTGVLLVPQDLLRKYILFARENCHPTLHEKHTDKLATVFAQMRKQSMVVPHS